MKPEGVQLLLETFEQANEIDKKRVQASLDRAQKRLNDKNIDLERSQKALKRAQNRLHVISRLS